MSTETLLQTPLHDWHAEHGGRMVDFAGWSMPVQYTSIVEEHTAVRERLGLFDVSHMGRLQFSGAGSEGLLDRLLTRRETDMQPGQIRYSLVCREDGGILDDVLVYRLLDQAEASEVGVDQPAFQLVVNASNREKIVDSLRDYLKQNPPAEDETVRMTDLTVVTAMIAVQGPKAIELLDPLVDFELTELKNYHGTYTEVEDKPCYLSRTGYTGEDGAEIICSANYAEPIWNLLLSVGEKARALACGLAARDTLRLEAAMPLYGHELSEEINPVQAGLTFAVNAKGREFVGSKAVAAAVSDENLSGRVGLEIEGKRPAREGAKVISGEKVVGEVTSGTFSPTLEKPIAMAYVEREFAKLGTELAVDIRGKQHAARIVKLPFYKRASS
ncbi:MAG: glycine cleavage system aminomethyltransferase GcvT [Lacipirellulaceae bacterium]